MLFQGLVLIVILIQRLGSAEVKFSTPLLEMLHVGEKGCSPFVDFHAAFSVNPSVAIRTYQRKLCDPVRHLVCLGNKVNTACGCVRFIKTGVNITYDAESNECRALLKSSCSPSGSFTACSTKCICGVKDTCECAGEKICCSAKRTQHPHIRRNFKDMEIVNGIIRLKKIKADELKKMRKYEEQYNKAVWLVSLMWSAFHTISKAVFTVLIPNIIYKLLN